MKKIKKIEYFIYKTGFKAVRFLTLLLAGVLTLCSLLWGYYAEDMTTQESVAHQEPLLLHLAGLAVLLFLLFLLFKFCRPADRRRSLLLAAALGWVCLWGLFLILWGRSIPTADSASVYTIAQALASGHMGVIHPTDSYLSYYPQQVGLVAFYEIAIRLWNLLPFPHAPHYILQCINVGLACAIVYFQYKTIRLLSHDNDGAAVCYLFLAMLNAPLIFYTSFVYGEIPSFAFLSGGIYLLLKYFETQDQAPSRRCLTLAGSLLSLVMSVALRKNALIVIIAVVIAVLWECLRKHKPCLLLYALLLTLSSAAVLPAITRIYEYRAGNVLSSGVPALSYVAMGMQESSRGNGWYNGFNFSAYADSNLDQAAANQASKEAIAASLSVFRNNPTYALGFYGKKFLSQWTDGSYFCRQATLKHTDGRADIVESLYTGTLARPFNHYCDLYQLLIYGSALLCLLQMRKPRNTPGETLPSLLPYTGMIAVLGGFLFHMVWEANSRYIFPYFLLLLPYAAQGLGNLYNSLSQIQKKKLADPAEAA